MSTGLDAVTSETAMPSGSAVDRTVLRDSALLGRAAVVIWNDVAAEGREQFYEWHDKEHMPERLALPGFRRGRRFVKPGHSPEWLTIYEATDVAALLSPQYLACLNAPTPATTRTLQYFRNTSRAVCHVVDSVGASTGGHVLAMRLAVDAGQGDGMCRHLREDVFPRALRRTGVLACHLFVADPDASYVNTAESSTRAFDVPPWVLLCETSTARAGHNAREAFDGEKLARLGVEVRGDAAVYQLEICRLASTAAQY